MSGAYDPLNYENLAQSVVNALLKNQTHALPPETAFEGSGVYAIYYTGELPFYKHVASPDCHTPIYVGKAIPSGGRKGGSSLSTSENALYSRLRQHAKSIEDASNLELSEFRCRYLVVVPVWIGLAERFLVSHFQPVWNTIIEGFGNHDPGAGRKDMKKPRWDVVHPGRSWATKLRAAETAEQIVRLIQLDGS